MASPIVENLVGRTFNRLTVLEQAEYSYYGNTDRKANWRCLCVCGKECIVLAHKLKSGHTKSCGCYKTEVSRKDPIQTCWDKYVYTYSKNAKNRGYDWNLTIDEVKNLASQNCYYCNNEPVEYTLAKKSYLRQLNKVGCKIDQEFANSKVIFTNGLDRVNNDKGYSANNVVPCCAICNSAKSDHSEEEWNAWLDRIAEHRTSKKEKK